MLGMNVSLLANIIPEMCINLQLEPPNNQLFDWNHWAFFGTKMDTYYFDLENLNLFTVAHLIFFSSFCSFFFSIVWMFC